RLPPSQQGGDMSRIRKRSGRPFPRRLDDLRDAARPTADLPPFGIGLGPMAARCLTFDRQVAEVQLRAFAAAL
ncbi:hypothetical protein, partial [Poseidonocella sp. HB161398]|uniref:hypothetical protein n=1 Tax=Poseidonocella sp. HB161398 TaxID=2320855 RepID=UPI00197FE85D